MNAVVADALDRLDELAVERSRAATTRRSRRSPRFASAGRADRMATPPTPTSSSPAAGGARGRRAGVHAGQGQRPRRRRCRHPRPRHPRPRRCGHFDRTVLRAEAGASMTGLAKRCAEPALPASTGRSASPARSAARSGPMPARTEARWPRCCARSRWSIVAAPRRASSAECGFAYRESRFKHADDVILGGVLDLGVGDPGDISALVDAHQAQRAATQPLADQNAGSVFRNPEGDHAGRLIEAAGLKGRRIGTAVVSTLHANFIVTDRGRGRHRRPALGDHVRATVADRFGIQLRYEIEFVGDSGRGCRERSAAGRGLRRWTVGRARGER